MPFQFCSDYSHCAIVGYGVRSGREYTDGIEKFWEKRLMYKYERPLP